jgi:microcystin-dependent protein
MGRLWYDRPPNRLYKSGYDRRSMNDVIMGMIYLFGGNFAPQGFAQCNGQLFQIAQNQALFTIIGTMYGGDGIRTFALPNIKPPVPDAIYIIATNGVYPSRN